MSLPIGQLLWFLPPPGWLLVQSTRLRPLIYIYMNTCIWKKVLWKSYIIKSYSNVFRTESSHTSLWVRVVRVKDALISTRAGLWCLLLSLWTTLSNSFNSQKSHEEAIIVSIYRWEGQGQWGQVSCQSQNARTVGSGASSRSWTVTQPCTSDPWPCCIQNFSKQRC